MMGTEKIRPERHPRLHSISVGAAWVIEDEYPSSAEWADAAEERLEYVERAGRLDSYWPKLRSGARQRDDALAEIKAAWFLERRCGLPVVQWEPPGADGKTGDFLVRLPRSNPVFVEVKRPNWRREVAVAEGQDSPRLARPKYLDGEARSTAPWRDVQGSARRAYQQMPDNGVTPTLLIIVDNLFLPLNLGGDGALAYYNPRRALYGEGGMFTAREPYERLGAVATLNEEHPGEITFAVFHNAHALPAVRMPRKTFPREYYETDGSDWAAPTGPRRSLRPVARPVARCSSVRSKY